MANVQVRTAAILPQIVGVLRPAWVYQASKKLVVGIRDRVRPSVVRIQRATVAAAMSKIYGPGVISAVALWGVCPHRFLETLLRVGVGGAVMECGVTGRGWRT